jgi:hypothetical protein
MNAHNPATPAQGPFPNRLPPPLPPSCCLPTITAPPAACCLPTITAPPAAKRARASALDAAVSTLEVPGLGKPIGLFVMADGTRLVCNLAEHVSAATPAGWLFSIAGDKDVDGGFEDGTVPSARFNCPGGMTVDAAGHIVVADSDNHALRRVSKAGEVSTLAGNGQEGFADGQGDAARLNCPCSVALAANDEIVVADTYNHAIRVVTESRPAVDAAAEAQEEKALETEKLKEDYGKLMKDGELADVVLVVEGERFIAHSLVLAARSEYCRGLLLWGMQ